MAYTIPSIPDHLTVKNSDTKEALEYANAMKIFDECQKKLAIGNFPFYEEICLLAETHPHILSICDRLNKAGYKASVKQIETIDYEGGGRGYFTCKTSVIYVDKPALF